MTDSNGKILVVEDNTQIRNFICFTLKTEQYQYVAAENGKTAMKLLISEQPDLMLLDLGLPDIDGIDIIREVRTWTEMPIIVVSARDQDHEKADALDIGADDYLTKPFSATELMARIRVALRHLHRQEQGKIQTVYTVGELTFDIEKHLVTLRGEGLHLTPMEFSMMSYLFKNQGKVLTTESIISEIWGSGYGKDTQALRTLMAGLRRKIESNPAKPRYIFTEIGVGYRLADQ
ncbi:MAG: response regulator [Eubacteriaceae bacterium]|jgi:two-component system KDP operon response regulator KdpE